MFQVILMSLLCMLSGCTYSINMAHTEGVASDTIDENDSVEPSVQFPPMKLPVNLK